MPIMLNLQYTYNRFANNKLTNLTGNNVCLPLGTFAKNSRMPYKLFIICTDRHQEVLYMYKRFLHILATSPPVFPRPWRG